MGTIYIKSQCLWICLNEGYDFDVFWQQFENWSWIILLFMSIVISFCIVFAWKISNQITKMIPSAFKILFKSFKANLGSDDFTPIGNQISSVRILILTALLMGNAIWLAYNGALLSELITPKVVKPFDDWDTLIKSKYRY